MTDFIVIVIIIAIVGGASLYIIRQKKHGVKCIGCPSGTTCPNSGKCSGTCGGHTADGCSCHTDTNE